MFFSEGKRHLAKPTETPCHFSWDARILWLPCAKLDIRTRHKECWSLLKLSRGNPEPADCRDRDCRLPKLSAKRKNNMC